jgi:hypothetical protein
VDQSLAQEEAASVYSKGPNDGSDDYHSRLGGGMDTDRSSGNSKEPLANSQGGDVKNSWVLREVRKLGRTMQWAWTKRKSFPGI